MQFLLLCLANLQIRHTATLGDELLIPGKSLENIGLA